MPTQQQRVNRNGIVGTNLRPVGICILTGGLSARMGRDKSRLRLGGRSLVGHVRTTAKTLGWPVRVIRRDQVKRCGPLGGICTALQTSRAEVEIFLACDMPFVSAGLLQKLVQSLRQRRSAAFVSRNGLVGFPFALRRETLPVVEEQIRRKIFSLQSLAAILSARELRASARQAMELFNINTEDDWTRARSMYAEIHGPQSESRARRTTSGLCQNRSSAQ